VEKELICLDTSILIDYFRKSNKENAVLFKLISNRFNFAVSVITVFELYNGAKDNQIEYWDDFINDYEVIPFDERANIYAIEISNNLRKRNKMIELPDIFIAATSIAYDLKFATLNVKHFDRIEGLKMIQTNE